MSSLQSSSSDILSTSQPVSVNGRPPRLPLPFDFLEQLTERLYTAETIARAEAYARHRLLDPSKFRLPWAMSSSDPTPFEFVRRWNRSPREYVDRLFIPVMDLRHDPAETGRAVLAGYDVRYCGDRPTLAKYIKIKRDKHVAMLYNVHEALGVSPNPHPWTVLLESATDVETLRLLGVPAIGALTAEGTPSFAMLLFGLFAHVYLMYDNDAGGESGTKGLLKAAALAGPAVSSAFSVIRYSGGDANDSVRDLGFSQLRSSLQSQIPELKGMR